MKKKKDRFIPLSMRSDLNLDLTDSFTVKEIKKKKKLKILIEEIPNERKTKRNRGLFD